MDIHSVCRICLEYLRNGNSYDLFLVPGLAKKLCMCTSLAVEPQDGFPKNICGVCYTRLSDMAEFQKLCVESVKKFQEMVANHAVVMASTFDVIGTPATAPIEGVQMPEDEEDHLNFDPLLHHKMEMLENEDDVFKMIDTVDKEEVEEIPTKVEEEVISSEESCDNDRDSDADFEFADNGGNDKDDDDDSDSDSDDDKPLASRVRSIKKEVKEENASKLDTDPKIKPKRKRIPAAERHLHRIIDCHICHQKFKKTKNYEQHMRYHNDKLPFQCEVENCKLGFTTANGLRLHVEHSHDETVEKLPCPQEGCDMQFTNRRLLNSHLKRIHKISREDVPKTYPCNECEKVFMSCMALKKHMFKHTGEELPFPCSICGKRFINNSALKDHLMRHAGIKNYICPFCGVGKTRRQELNTHMAIHDTEKKFKCQLCPHASHNKQNLRMHIRVVHDKIKDFACQFCGKQFSKSNACKMHEMTHTGEKKCECKVCGKRFLYPKVLTQHLKTHEKSVLKSIEVYRKRKVELGEMPAEEAEQMSDLQNAENFHESHKKVTDEIRKVCADSVNSIPRDPRRVERVHIADLAGTSVNPIPEVALPSWSPQINFTTKEGKFICPDCGQRFNNSGNMRRHHKVIHQGVKDYACRYCQKRFGKPDSLKHHEMTHTGEKPHACTHCDMRFIQVVGLKRHMKVHQRRPNYKPRSAFKAKEVGAKKERKRQVANLDQDKEPEIIVEEARQQIVELSRPDEQKKREAIAEEALKLLDEIKKQGEELQRRQREALDSAPKAIPKERLPPGADISIATNLLPGDLAKSKRKVAPNSNSKTSVAENAETSNSDNVVKLETHDDIPYSDIMDNI